MRAADENIIILALINKPQDVTDATPCSVRLDFKSLARRYEDALEYCHAHQECETVYLVPKHTISHSDVAVLATKLASGTRHGQRLVLVCSHASKGLEDYIMRIAPNLIIMNLKN